MIAYNSKHRSNPSVTAIVCERNQQKKQLFYQPFNNFFAIHICFNMGTESTVVMREVRKRLRSKIVLTIISPINDEIDKRFKEASDDEAVNASKHHLQIGGSNSSLGFAIKCACDDPVSFYLKKTTLDSPSKLNDFKKTILKHVGIEVIKIKQEDQIMSDLGQTTYSPIRPYQLPSINELLPIEQSNSSSAPILPVPNTGTDFDNSLLFKLDSASASSVSEMVPHLSNLLSLLEKADIIPSMLSSHQINELAKLILRESEAERQKNVISDSS